MSPFLKRCQCTRGFFTLRPCDRQAPHTCPTCQRTICDDHWSMSSGTPVCVECAARADERQGAADDRFDSLWFHRYRHSYYSSHHYRPLYVGLTPDPYYDQYDFRAFTPKAAAAGDAGQDDGDGDGGSGGGFGDS